MTEHRISAATIGALARIGVLRVALRSPLHRWIDAAGAAEIALDAELAECLALLANPTAVVRVRSALPSQVVPGQSPTRPDTVEVRRFAPQAATHLRYIRDDHACGLSRDGDALVIGPRQPIAELAADLADAAACTGALAGREYALWPSVLESLSAIWRDAGAATALCDDDLAPADRAAIDALAAHGAVVADGGAYAIRPQMRPWLELVWSGHVVQIEYLRLRFGVAHDDSLDAPGDRLLFFGPEGQRIRSEQVGGAALAALAGGEPPEPQMIRLSAPPLDRLRHAIDTLLRVR